MFDKLLLAVDPSKRLKPAREYAIALSEKLEVPLVAAFISNPKKAGTCLLYTSPSPRDTG